jgi:hypothetical protein
MSWADDVRKLDIRTNADTPEQVASAIAFGAQGIGLNEPSICSSRAAASMQCAR